MSWREFIAFAAGTLTRHRLRSFLTLLGVSIGVAAVLVLTAIGEGARRYVTDQFASIGTNLIIVLPGRTETMGGLPGMGGAPKDLTLADARALQRNIPQIRRMAPISLGTEEVAFRERRRAVPVLGSNADLLEVRHLQMAAGQFLPATDLERGAPVVVLGKKVADELFQAQNPLGMVVRIGQWRMRVIGVTAARGVHLGTDMDDAVIVPVATGMKMFDRSSLFRIIVEVAAHQEIESTKSKILEILEDRHRERDVTCLTQDAVVGSLNSILNGLTAALAGIAAISLAVAGIGIMNLMLVTVSERRFEIGLLKAIGAFRSQILWLFLAEASLISAAGGLLGLAVGWGAVEVFHHIYPTFPAAIPLWTIALAMAVSVGVGVTFGLLPAGKASRLDPVLALARAKR